jgi:4-amino-4-deoxy-L-arabinose transferase-like glycosyltransferase
MRDMTISIRNRDLLILLAICFVCFFWRLGSVSLFDFNEGLYVEAAREMYLRGDLVTPQVNGAFFFDKPPLVLWLAVGAFHLFGVNEFAARLPVAMAASLLVLLTYWFGARFLCRKTGLLGAAILALSPLYFFTARQMTMDIVQSLFFGAALAAFFLGYTAADSKGKRWYYLFWSSCGFGYMAKSIPGLFPIAVALAFVVFQDLIDIRAIGKRIWETKPLSGLLLLFLVLAPWHYLAFRANGPVFYEDYWVVHHLKLASGADFSHIQPWYFYLPALMAGAFPWSLFIPFAALNRRRQEQSDSASESSHLTNLAYRFCAVWFIVVIVLFSAMRSKLISYLIPMYPAAALLISERIVRSAALKWKPGVMKGFYGLVAGASIAITAVCGVYIRRTPASLGAQAYDFSAAWMWVVQGMVLVSIGLVAAFTLSILGKRTGTIAAFALSISCFYVAAVARGITTIELNMNAPLHRLARVAGAHALHGDKLAVFIGQPRRPSVFFYMPDAIFKPLASRKRGTEILMESSEEASVNAFLLQNIHSYILTDSKRASALQKSYSSVDVECSEDKWVLLRAGSNGALAHVPAPPNVSGKAAP